MAASLPTPPLPSPSLESQTAATRKRVCKACDRCRLKKSKCDGSSPCGRCRSDNAICVFGERKKSHDKAYPKGYVEMLEQQQSQLVSGLQELYQRLVRGETWPGGGLANDPTLGRPLTHDILKNLGALENDGRNDAPTFDENLSAIQQKLIAGGAHLVQRQESPESGSERDHSQQVSPIEMGPPYQLFSDAFTAPQTAPISPAQSSFPQSSQNSQRGIKFEPQIKYEQQASDDQTLQSFNTLPSMNPVVIQRQSWPQPSLTYGEPMDFLPNDTTSTLGVPDWTEVDFNSFLNASMA